jgi:hypothetical protein
MNEIIANLLIENLYQEIKITALAKLLFENNIISEKELDDKTSKLLKDKDFLKKQLNKILPEDIYQESFQNILNDFMAD